MVADILYGENRGFAADLDQRDIPYVLAVKPSHYWWHPVGEIGWVEEVAKLSHYDGPDESGEWVAPGA